MLQKQTVSPKLLELLEQLQQISLLKEFALVGGTALALQLGHRSSIDIDLFTLFDFDEKKLVEELEKRFGAAFLLLSSSKNAINCVVSDIKVDLIKHGYAYVEDRIEEENIRMLALSDIAAMKLNAITGNGSRIKDFIDVYFLLDIFSLEQLFAFYKKKYTQQDLYHVKKSLVYFNDILPETWENVQLIREKQLTFSSVKQKLKKELQEYEKRNILL
ncbi:hypothetical protein FACS189440_04880 [Bacteroidia bacterium]|nr:hypothetical protein FACS189440_04880 [Bacteroidia bacterium]